jgi:hypothetical protein
MSDRPFILRPQSDHSARAAVTKRFPERNGQFEYRIKGAHEPHERIATEDELSADDV